MIILGILVVGFFAKTSQDIKRAGARLDLSSLVNKAVAFGLKAYSTIFFWYLVV